MSGFVTMHREVLDHPMFAGDASRLGAWFWLVANACWKASKVRIKGETVELQRGELSFSVRFLADKWGWSKSRVDRFIAELRAEAMIETRSKIGTVCDHKAGQGQSIITICNYNKYQDVPYAPRDNTGTTGGTTAGQGRDKEEQGNNRTTVEESPPTPPEEQPEAQPEQPKKPKSIPVKAVDLPAWLPRDVWHRWVSHRRSLRSDITTNNAGAIVAHLDQLHQQGHDPIAVINHSILRGIPEFEMPPPAPPPPAIAPRRTNHADQPSPRRRRDNDEPTSPLVRAVIELQADRAARRE